MTEQSEHLSSAQIENYGNRTSGAGPEAAQRDEHQRANHQSSDGKSLFDQRIDQQVTDQSASDQRVEAHLADCASCRNRVLDFHRHRFALLSGPAPDARPTDSALADSKFANPKYPADPQVRTAATPECPSDDALRRLAAGLTPDDAAPATGDALTTRLLQHASTCDHCGPLLRTYTEIFSDDFTPEEQATLANLRNSSTEWQKNTARQMLETAGTAVKTSADTADTSAADKQSSQQKSFKGSTATTTGRKLFFWKWALVPVSAAVVAVTAFSIWYTQRDTPKKVEALIAQAYTEERPIVLRWPGAAWGQYSVQRGTMFEAKSTSLMQAEIAVGRQTEKTLQETAWIRVVAEKEIIAGHPQIAIPALEQAVRSHPSSAPLLLDLAIAYFGQGEQTHSQESYEKSRDLLGGVLQREPTNTVARFNRALVYERLNAKDKAADDWKTFLKTEKDVHWLAEAQKNLTDLGDLN